jgi:sulfur carrier protein ThiS
MRLSVRTLPEGENHTVDLAEGATGFELLAVLDRNPDAHLLLRGRTPIPMDAPLEPGEDLAVVAIVSGGREAADLRGSTLGARVGQPF